MYNIHKCGTIPFLCLFIASVGILPMIDSLFSNISVQAQCCLRFHANPAKCGKHAFHFNVYAKNSKEIVTPRH